MTKQSKIKKIRIQLGLTQGQLASKLKTTQGAVSHWECGVCKPSISSVEKIMKLAAKKGIYFSLNHLRS
jgi:DNA-binding transcriptional regulator YiaG